MADATIRLQDRQAIYHTLAWYVWSMDTGDIEGVVATFTPAAWSGMSTGNAGTLRRGLRLQGSLPSEAGAELSQRHPARAPAWHLSKR